MSSAAEPGNEVMATYVVLMLRMRSVTFPKQILAMTFAGLVPFLPCISCRELEALSA